MDKSYKFSIGGREAIAIIAICCVISASYFRANSQQTQIIPMEFPAAIAPGHSGIRGGGAPIELGRIPNKDRFTPSTPRHVDHQVQFASAQLDLDRSQIQPNRDATNSDLEEIRPLVDSDDDDLRQIDEANDRGDSLPIDGARDRRLPKIDDVDIQSEFEGDSQEPLIDIGHESLEEFLFTLSSTPITTAVHKVNWSLDDAINAALLYSHQIESLRVQTVENFQQIGVEYGRFDLTSFLQTNFRDSNTPVGNNFEVDGAADRIRGETFNFNYGVRQELLSGGQIELSRGFGTRDDDSGVLNPPDQANSSLSLSLSKELLRGSGRAIGLSQVLIAQHSAQAGQLDNIATIANLLEQVSDAYWDIFSARAALISAIETAQRAENVLRDLEARTNIDADPNLLEQARVSIVQQRAQADSAYAALARTQFELIRLVNAPELMQNVERIEIIPTGINFDTFVSPDVVSRQNTAIHNRTEIRSVVENIRRAQVEHQFSLNELLPRLAFSVEGTFEGLSGDRDLNAAAINQFDSNATYELGLNFEFPLQNRDARFQKRRAELTLARLNREWSVAIEGVKRDVLVSIQDVETNHSLVSRQRQIFDSSLKRLTFLEQRRFRIPQAGSIPSLQLGQLLDVQSQLARSKSDFASALAEREKSQFSLNRASGILVTPIAQGLDNPGTHKFLSIYRQSFESNKIYRDHTKQLANEIRLVSQKERGTWRPDSLLARVAAGRCCNCESGTTCHEVVENFDHQGVIEYSSPEYSSPGFSTPGYSTPEFSAPEFVPPAHSTPTYSTPSYPTPATINSTGELFSPDLTRSNQPRSHHQQRLNSTDQRSLAQRIGISRRPTAPPQTTTDRRMPRQQFAVQMQQPPQRSTAGGSNRAQDARPNNRQAYQVRQVQYQQPLRRTQ